MTIYPVNSWNNAHFRKNISIKLRNDSNQLQWFNYNHKIARSANILKTVLIFASFTVSINAPRDKNQCNLSLMRFFLLWYRYYSVKYNLDFHFLSIFRDVFRKEVNEHKPREKKLHGENKRLSWFMKDCLNCQRILDMIDGILNSDCVFMFFFR